MPVAKARRASELIFEVQVEEPRLALPAAFPFDVLFAVARTRARVAVRLVVQRPGFEAATVFAAVSAEVVVVRVAAVAFVASDSWFALAFAFRVALEAAGAGRVAVAGDAVVVLALVVVLATSLAVRTVAVGRTVQTVAPVAGALI